MNQIVFKYFTVKEREDTWNAIHIFLRDNGYDVIYPYDCILRSYPSAHYNQYLAILDTGFTTTAPGHINEYVKYETSTHVIHCTKHMQYSQHVATNIAPNYTPGSWSQVVMVKTTDIKQGWHYEFSLIVELPNDADAIALKLSIP